MVPWVFSIPGERWLEGDIPSPEEHFSLFRGFTNLGKTFHTEGGEDIVQASSGQVQTWNEALWLFPGPYGLLWGTMDITISTAYLTLKQESWTSSLIPTGSKDLKTFRGANCPAGSTAWISEYFDNVGPKTETSSQLRQWLILHLYWRSRSQSHRPLGYKFLSKEGVSKSLKSLKTLCCCSSL